MSPATSDPVARFHSRIRKAENGCWLWDGASVRGRGQFSVNNRVVLVTRFAYQHFKGPIPQGMFVCHTCDEPRCANPDHLWLGTPRENVLDALKKRRMAQSAKQGVCVNGHPIEGRECKVCAKQRNRNYSAERRAARQKTEATIAALRARVSSLEDALRLLDKAAMDVVYAENMHAARLAVHYLSEALKGSHTALKEPTP